MLWDMEDSFRGIGKFLAYSFGIVFYIMSHLIILLLAHAAAVGVQDSVDLDQAITPLHSMIMADRWEEGYLLMRDTVFDELPFYPQIRDIFFRRSELQLIDLLYDAAKISCSGVISYILCRINTLVSSEDHPLLMCILNSYWTSISTFSALIIVLFLKTLPNIICIGSCIAIIIISLILLTVFSKVSIGRLGVPIKTKRIFGIHFNGIIVSLMDSLFIFIVSCLTFDIFSNYITDDVSLIMTMLIIAVILTIAYNMIKEQLN
ncbi:MAG: hypothetical protein IJB15_14500 [Clostridia bacterium]|nr:hypothetical protein [Clostridia bacterium]